MNKIYVLVCAVFLFSCHSESTNQSLPNHANEQGHDHSMDEGTSITRIGEHFELFAEMQLDQEENGYQVTAHFTILDGYQPVKVGELRISGSALAKPKVIKAPSKPGIFQAIIPSSEFNIHKKISFEIRTADTLEVFDVDLHQLNLTKHRGGKEIKYLKEQAWKSNFALEEVVPKNINNVVNTFGWLKEQKAEVYTIIAKHGGEVVFEYDHLYPGVYLNPETDIMLISSEHLMHDNFMSNFQEQKLKYEIALKNYNRSKALFKDRLITEKEFLETEEAYKIEANKYELKKEHFMPGGSHIHVPKAGTLKTIWVVDGDFVEAGDPLLEVINTSKGMLEVAVPAKYFENVGVQTDLAFSADHFRNSVYLSELGGRFISIEPNVRASSGYLMAYFEISQMPSLPMGSPLDIKLLMPGSKKGLLIPLTSVIEDRGLYYAIRMIEGELFELTEITLGSQNGKEVEVLSGLQEGDYVVSKNAMQVFLAGNSGELPAHAHAH